MDIVKYHGEFGFIKPWTAVRDALTYSQQFLTPSVLEGIEKKLFPETLNSKGLQGIIKRHKLTYKAIDKQQEQTQTRGIKINQKAKTAKRERSILTRGVLVEPQLILAFADKKSAEKAFRQHICLARNEDILLPVEMEEISEEEFNKLDGFELELTSDDSAEDSILLGYNRFDDYKPMYGRLTITGKPVRKNIL